jgi:hypothetical protein
MTFFLRFVGRNGRHFLCALLLAACAIARPAFAQTCDDSVPEDARFVYRNVLAQSRGRAFPGLPIKPGESYTEAGIKTAMDTVRGEIRETQNAELDVRNAVSVLYITRCVVVVPQAECNLAFKQPNCVDVTIQPRYLNFEVPSRNAVAEQMPQSLTPRLKGTADPALLLAPRVGMKHDNALGAMETVGFSTDIFAVASALRGTPAKDQGARLVVDGEGGRSLNKNFYTAAAGLGASARRRGHVLEQWTLGTRFSADRKPIAALSGVMGSQPLASTFDTMAPLLTNMLRTGGTMQFRSPFGLPDEASGATGLPPGYENSTWRDLLHTVGVGFWVRHASNRLESRVREHVTENGMEGRLILDGRFWRYRVRPENLPAGIVADRAHTSYNGVARLAIWGDAGRPEDGTTYRRLLSRFTTQFDFARRYTEALEDDPNIRIENYESISLELSVGGGKLWNPAPLYAQFYGGNSFSDLLYDSPDTIFNADMPQGPLFRAVGIRQLAVVENGSAAGGTAFWHANATLAIPFRKWTRALIPTEVITDDDGTVLGSLRQLFKNQATSAQSFTQAALANRGMTPDDAAAEAKRIFHAVRPGFHFLADQAPLVALKPLVLFDVARIYSPVLSDKARLGVGVGAQLTIVVAKMEAGYVLNVNRRPGEPYGNMLVRLVFRKLF